MDDIYLQVDDPIFIKLDPYSVSSDEYSNDTMPNIANVKTMDSSMSKKRSNSVRTSAEYYGPILVRKRQTAAPTIATGRRSKNTIFEGEDASKHEIRRMKNRESARNLKILRDNIEQDLEAKINDLELEEKNLHTSVDVLRSYKQYLERRYEQVMLRDEPISPTRTTKATCFEMQNISRNEDQSQSQIEAKQEPSSPLSSSLSSSPQWQLSFCI
ncbi:hypothetical protein I4U23_001549 [Adineta vaga]|nr:hypothetical protein I4U23_001549 [Adineta vaga]